ncbi:MAG TPA: S41 family peptidase, partial [Algoriphagus sp.]|nr:S41 family peptidase [Algoriphagus sp.]
MRITTILLFSFLFSFSCQRPHKNQFESFFEQTFNVIKYNSVLKDSLNWVDLKKTVKDSIKSFNSNDDAYNAIDYTVHLVNDGHSIFLVGEKPSNKTPPIDNNPIPDRIFTPHIDSKIIDKEIGYIKLTGFSAINDSLQKQYTLEVRKALLTLDSTGELSGWIIDLRTHGGGRMSSESLGLSPLFENELIGYAKETKNELIEISSTKSKLSNGNYIQETLNYDSTLINKNKKIAVLIDKNTVSSG